VLNLRLADDIDQDTFARKSTEIRDRLASIKLQIYAFDGSHDETAELASKAFELSQTLCQQLPLITTQRGESSKSCV
jgi:site-specific DNA recombinase